MSYQALYRTYRPQKFDEVVGQKYIVTTLRNAVMQNKIAHAYLFCGPRGTGKTTIARLLAKAVNCDNKENPGCNECESCQMITEGTHPDIVEIDGASYGRVETARDLIEKVKYAPLKGKYKVYIIDEVHMLSDSAFNALLKTLEEPPTHAIFILATTDPQKVLPTIISRCQRYDFTRVEAKDIYERLVDILKTEKIEYEEEALKVISKLADGGLRDALSILDQVIAYSPKGVKVTDVYAVYGLTTPQQKYELINYILSKDSSKLLDLVNRMFDSGMDIRRLTIDLVEIIKECVVYHYTKDEKLVENIDIDNVKEVLKNASVDRLLKMIDVLMETSGNYRFTSNINSIFEVATLKMMSLDNEIKQVAPKQEIIRETLPIEKSKPEPVKLDKQEEKKNIEPEKSTFEEEFLLSLLVGANKQSKEQILNIWNRLEDYRIDSKLAKYANLLISTKLIAASSDFAIVSVNSLSEADMINDTKSEKEFMSLTNKTFGASLKVYAITINEYSKLIELFKTRREQGTLPKYEKKEVKKEEKVYDPIEDTMVNMFGKDTFEVVE